MCDMDIDPEIEETKKGNKDEDRSEAIEEGRLGQKEKIAKIAEKSDPAGFPRS